jgi:TatD DNase family protein
MLIDAFGNGAAARSARDSEVGLVVAGAASEPEALELIGLDPVIRVAAGLPPSLASAASDGCLESIRESMGNPGVLLWGRIGLDYAVGNAAPAVQQDTFRRQLRMALEAGKPVVLCCAGAWDDFFEILEADSPGAKYRGYIQGFSGTPEIAHRCLGLGLLLSFAPESPHLARVAPELRLDQILVESGSGNPAHAVDAAHALAAAMEVTFDDITRNVAHNFRRLTGEPAWAEGDVLVYPIRDRLYINLTNRCTARCVFCRRETSPIASGYNLRLDREHEIGEYLEAIGDPSRFIEIVFCGFGEPTLRLDALLAIGQELKRQGTRIRLNTNGHGNLIHGRDIAPELATCVDEISISIDAPDAVSYRKIVRPDFGDDTFDAVVEFARACVGVVPRVTLTAVNVPAVDLDACRRLAASIGAELREREYQPMVGSTDFVRNS